MAYCSAPSLEASPRPRNQVVTTDVALDLEQNEGDEGPKDLEWDYESFTPPRQQEQFGSLQREKSGKESRRASISISQDDPFDMESDLDTRSRLQVYDDSGMGDDHEAASLWSDGEEQEAQEQCQPGLGLEKELIVTLL